MNTPKRSVGRRLVAALGAAALSLVGLTGVASAATPVPAFPGPDPTSTDVHNAQGGPDRVTGKLTIHKIKGAETANLHNGTEQSVSGEPLSGATFTVTPVTQKDTSLIDLTTAAGWESIKDATVAGVQGSGWTLDTAHVQTEVTGDDGLATFDNLPIGLYLVQETVKAPGIVSLAAPFLVTIPLWTDKTSSNDPGWNYSVHAYPKNTPVGEPTKDVADPTGPLGGNIAAGATVTWTVKAPIPALNRTDSFNKFIITDTLDSKLAYQSPARVSVAGIDDLTVGTDYTVSSVSPVTVTFLDPGLSKLEALAKDAAYDGHTSVVVEIDTKVREGGSISNTANVNINDSSKDTPQVTTQWGFVKIRKVDSTTQGSLPGAKFSVYATQADAANGQNPIASGTTDAQGELTFGPLWVATNNPAVTNEYFVKEIQAPDGYVLDPQVRTVTVAPNALADVTFTTIPNTKANVPNLPLTGANGQLLALIGGGSLVLLAAGTALVARKRSHQD